MVCPNVSRAKLLAAKEEISLVWLPILKLMLLKAFSSSPRSSRFAVSVNRIFLTKLMSNFVNLGP